MLWLAAASLFVPVICQNMGSVLRVCCAIWLHGFEPHSPRGFMLPPVLRDLACAGWLRKKTAAPTRPSTIVATASTVLSIGARARLRGSKQPV